MAHRLQFLRKRNILIDAEPKLREGEAYGANANRYPDSIPDAYFAAPIRPAAIGAAAVLVIVALVMALTS
jgi:hypothetical protein